jgi:hypothetical protein
MALLATALVCTAIGAGCGGGPAVAHPAARPASHFAISFERSGGLKASVETLVVRPGLRAFATAPKGDRQVSAHFKMDAQRAEDVRRELARAHFAQVGSTAPGSCADCYVYKISYHGHTARFLDSKVPDRVGEAIAMLEAEVIDHVYRHVGFRGG